MKKYYLLSVTETYRVDTVDEALAMQDEFDADPNYELTQFSYTTKVDKKADAEYQVVKAKKVFNVEKNPTSTYSVEYVR